MLLNKLYNTLISDIRVYLHNHLGFNVLFYLFLTSIIMSEILN